VRSAWGTRSSTRHTRTVVTSIGGLSKMMLTDHVLTHAQNQIYRLATFFAVLGRARNR
jgi:hypothetical protein